MPWSLAPAALVIFGINLSDRHFVRYVIPVPTMVQCQMAKPTILGAMKIRFAHNLPEVHLSARCARRDSIVRRKPQALWRAA